jgi:predicted O-methyltransferase YrrM
MTFEELKNTYTGEGSTLGDYKFLYGFVSMIRPKTIFEIGTNRGGSAIAMAMALRDEGLDKSRIVSVDINEGCLEHAKKHLEQLGLLKYVDLRLGDSSLVWGYPGFDVVFIDGDHTYEGSLADFNNVRTRSKYILIHDNAQSEGSRKLVKTIKLRGAYEVLDLNEGQPGVQWSLGEQVCHAFPGFAIVKGGLLLSE